MQVKCTWSRVKKEGAKVSAAWKSCLVCPEPPSLALGLWAAVLVISLSMVKNENFVCLSHYPETNGTPGRQSLLLLSKERSEAVLKAGNRIW